MSGDESAVYWQPSTTCYVCGDPSTGESTAYLCPRCKRVLHPNLLSSVHKEARVRHMREQWERNGAFVCTYTGVELDLDDPSSVKFREWEHAIPGRDESVVLAAALVNRMKCYLNVEEFEHMVIALANRFKDPNAQFDERAWPMAADVPRSPQAPD